MIFAFCCTPEKLAKLDRLVEKCIVCAPKHKSPIFYIWKLGGLRVIRENGASKTRKKKKPAGISFRLGSRRLSSAKQNEKIIKNK